MENKNPFTKFHQPHFLLEDLKSEDLKEDNYVDPLHKIRHPIEPERLASIYQQAFIYDLLYKFAKDSLPDIPNAKINSENLNSDSQTKDQTTDTQIDSVKAKVLEYLFKNDSQYNRDTAKLADTETENIWNTDDLNILRRNFSTIKNNNFLLRSQTIFLEEENKMLKSKLEQIQLESQLNRNEKISFEQENERMYIRLQDLESRFCMYSREMDVFDKEKEDFVTQIRDLKNTNQNLKNENYKLEFQINKLEQQINSMKHEQKMYYNELIENIKLKYKKKLRILEQNFLDLNSTYNEDKQKYLKTQKALEHLRVHFMENSTYNNKKDKINDDLIRIL
jgi:hypothetical protein